MKSYCFLEVGITVSSPNLIYCDMDEYFNLPNFERYFI